MPGRHPLPQRTLSMWTIDERMSNKSDTLVDSATESDDSPRDGETPAKTDNMQGNTVVSARDEDLELGRRSARVAALEEESSIQQTLLRSALKKQADLTAELQRERRDKGNLKFELSQARKEQSQVRSSKLSRTLHISSLASDRSC